MLYEVITDSISGGSGPEGVALRGLLQQLSQAGGADGRRVNFADILANLIPLSRLGSLVLAAPGAIGQQETSYNFV